MDMEHYFSEKQESKLKKKKISAFLRGNKLEFYTGSGVFSKNRIDRGTELLIESAIIKPSGKVLDLGAGYGAVGIAVAKAFPKCDAVLSDVNERAVELAEENVKLNNLKNVETIKSSFFENINENFDAILLNPPQTAGKDVCFRMIEESSQHLNRNGTLQVVARHNKGGKTLEKKMAEVFGNVQTIAKGGGYRIYLSVNI